MRRRTGRVRQIDGVCKPMDKVLLGLVVLLVIIGVLFVLDTSYSVLSTSKAAGFDKYHFLKKQLIFAGIGFAFLAAFSQIPLKFLRAAAWWLTGFSVFLLVAVLQWGHGINGAKRWFVFGPISFQPSEFAKIAVVLLIAKLVSEGKINLRKIDSRWIVPFGVLLAVAGLIVKEPDMGTGIAVVGTYLAMALAAGMNFFYVVFAAGGVALLGFIEVVTAPWRMARVAAFFDPWANVYGQGYQSIHSLVALGTGGIFGVGLCEGREKLYIPYAYADFIFATVGEELGLIGGVVLLALFAALTIKGLLLGMRCKNTFGSLVAIGITSVITIQVLVHIAAVSGCIPTTGVPLPFMSAGGSSLIAMLMAAGLLLAVSRQTNLEFDERRFDENCTNGGRHRRARVSRSKRKPSSSRRKRRR